MYLSNEAWWEQTDIQVCSPTFHVENVRINHVWLVRSSSCVLSLLLQANQESSSWLLSKCKNSAQSASLAKPIAVQNPNFVLSIRLASSEAAVRSQVWINSHLSVLLQIPAFQIAGKSKHNFVKHTTFHLSMINRILIWILSFGQFPNCTHSF